MHRRRVMFLNWRDTTHPEGGGSERYVEQLAGWLAEAGHEVLIHCGTHGRAAKSERRDGVRLLRRGGRFTVYPYGLLAVRRHRPDVVIDVQNGIPFFSVLVHRRVVRLVHHVSRQQWLDTFGPVVGRLGWWLESRVAPPLYRGARCVAVSTPTRDDLVALGVRPDLITVVHNATEPGGAPVEATPTPTITVVARLVGHKQVEHAVEVVARLAPEFPDLVLRIVGEGPSREDILATARRLGVADRVRLLGSLDERAKNDAIGSAWLLLCPSGKEGWARVVMEAAVREVPAVAYADAGGVRESIVDGETGLLADDLDAMVAHTRRLLRDPAERTTMGKAAAAHAATFSPERTRDAFLAVLDSALA